MVTGASQDPTRAEDMATGSHAAGAVIPSQQTWKSGSITSSEPYICTSSFPTDRIGTDSITFQEYCAAKEDFTRVVNTLELDATKLGGQLALTYQPRLGTYVTTNQGSFQEGGVMKDSRDPWCQFSVKQPVNTVFEPYPTHASFQ